MADQKVKTTVRDWKTECAMADAADALETANSIGLAAVLNGKDPVVYEFSNGVRKTLGPKPA
jgi:hypothetical protein